MFVRKVQQFRKKIVKQVITCVGVGRTMSGFPSSKIAAAGMLVGFEVPTAGSGTLLRIDVSTTMVSASREEGASVVSTLCYFFLFCFTTLRGRIMLLPFMALVAFGFVGLLRRWLSRLKTGREVISRYSSQKIGQADKKYLRSCGSRTLMFFGFLGLRRRDR